MNSRIRISFSAKLLMIFLFIQLTTNIAIAISAYKTSSGGLKENVYSQIDAVTTDAVNQIAAINEKHFTSIRFIAGLAVMKDESISLEEKQKELVVLVKELGGNYENVAFYDKDGYAITAAGQLINMKDRAYFTEAMKGNEYISNPTFSPVVNQVLQQYSVPVRNDGKVVGVIVMLIKGNSVLETIGKIDMGNGMHPSVIDYKTGETIADPDKDPDEKDDDKEIDDSTPRGKALKNAFAGKESIEDFMDSELNTRLIASYKKIPGTSWTIFALAPYNSYFGSLKLMRIKIAVISIITIILAIVLISVLVRFLIRPLKTVKTSIETIASGSADLSQRVPEASNDEIGDVVKGFNTFMEKLQGIVTNLQASKAKLLTVDGDLQSSTRDTSTSITQIIANIEHVNTQILAQSDSVEETAGAVNQISMNIKSLENMIESQASCVTEASAAVEQMIGNINSVSSSVVKMIESFKTLRQHSTDGSNTQKNANEKILRIEEESKMLRDANSAIASIASQTNLLAMNAAIEAAHAGEAGKGFAVVADEIRKLSETSTSQSKTIGSELKKIQATINEIVEVSNATNTAFTSIAQSIEDTSQIIDQIKGAMEEQQIGSKQITEALRSMNDSTSDVQSASGEMTEGNKRILAEIQKLQDATDVIKSSIGEMHNGANHINDTGTVLTEVSDKMKDSIDKIGIQIDEFKV
ncbi:MAG: HAMP domain-containing protein [Treponema sp.]|nr:HAMP domain-containing protein [Treponema sp.]